MFHETMTAEEFTTELGNRIASNLRWVSVVSTSVDQTGGGCSANVINLRDTTGRECSLVLTATHDALGGESVANIHGDDGEFLVVGIYDGQEWRGEIAQTYDGWADPRDIHVGSIAALVNYCGDYVREWQFSPR